MAIRGIWGTETNINPNFLATPLPFYSSLSLLYLSSLHSYRPSLSPSFLPFVPNENNKLVDCSRGQQSWFCSTSVYVPPSSILPLLNTPHFYISFYPTIPSHFISLYQNQVIFVNISTKGTTPCRQISVEIKGF